jgi:hypothetical protein
LKRKIARNLEIGKYKIEIKATDQFGKPHSKKQVLAFEN